MDIATANESTDIVGTARSVMTLLLDFLARLQRLPLTSSPRLRILPTDTLNLVTLNRDLSVSQKIVVLGCQWVKSAIAIPLFNRSYFGPRIISFHILGINVVYRNLYFWSFGRKFTKDDSREKEII